MKLLKNITLCFAFVFTSASVVLGQQMPQFTQNSFAKMLYNPAFAGSSEGININSLFRQQWVGFKDDENTSLGPKTFFATVDMPVRFLGGGLGLTIMDDKLGYEENLSIKLSYAYHVNLPKDKLNFGLVVGLQDRNLDGSSLNPSDPGDPLTGGLSGESTSMIFDGGLGVYYESHQHFWASLSALQLIGAKSNFGTDYTVQKNKMHLVFIGGYNYTFLRNPKIELLPSISFISDMKSFQASINATMRYNKKVWAGVSYRLQDGFSINLGVRVKDFKVGYAYDVPTNGLGSFGSHEIGVNYCFKLKLKKTPKSYRNTRFL